MSICKQEFQRSNFLLGHPHPEVFATSCCHTPSIWYLVYRTVFALYFFITLLYVMIDANTAMRLAYFTNWTYILLAFLCIWQFVCAVYHYVRVRKSVRALGAGDSSAASVYSDMPVIFKVEWVLSNVVSTGSFIVTIIYWSLLAQGIETVEFSNATVHIVNAVYVLLDRWLTGTPTRLLHFWHPMLYLAVYGVFTVIYYFASGGNALYSILDYYGNAGMAVAWTLLLVLVIPSLIHAFFWLRHICAQALFRHCCGRCGGKAYDDNNGGKDGKDEDEEVKKAPEADVEKGKENSTDNGGKINEGFINDTE